MKHRKYYTLMTLKKTNFSTITVVFKHAKNYNKITETQNIYDTGENYIFNIFC